MIYHIPKILIPEYNRNKIKEEKPDTIMLLK